MLLLRPILANRTGWGKARSSWPVTHRSDWLNRAIRVGRPYRRRSPRIPRWFASFLDRSRIRCVTIWKAVKIVCRRKYWDTFSVALVVLNIRCLFLCLKFINTWVYEIGDISNRLAMCFKFGARKLDSPRVGDMGEWCLKDSAARFPYCSFNIFCSGVRRIPNFSSWRTIISRVCGVCGRGASNCPF